MIDAVRRAAHALPCACCSSCWPRPSPGASPSDAAGRPATRRRRSRPSRRAAGRAHLHAGRLRPLRAAQRARHAEQRARLLDRRRRHRAARPRPGDRQRADQRRALLGQVDRHLHRAAADQRRQRRPDRDRRRRDAQHFRPDRPGRQRHHRRRAASPAIIVWRPQIRARPHAGAAAQRRGLGQRLARRHPIYA